MSQSRRRGIASILAMVVIAGAGCGPGASRPTTAARIAIVAPRSHTPLAGTDIVVQVRLTGAKVVASSGSRRTLRPDRGHVHLLVDGQPALMSYSLRAVLPRLAPGVHTIEADFVATDHAPFSNRVSDAVSVTVA